MEKMTFAEFCKKLKAKGLEWYLGFGPYGCIRCKGDCPIIAFAGSNSPNSSFRRVGLEIGLDSLTTDLIAGLADNTAGYRNSHPKEYLMLLAACELT